LIIDIDSHFEPGNDWLEPYPGLAGRLPKLEPARLAVDAILGDLLRDLPEDEHPPLEDLLPPGLLTLYGDEKAAEAERREEFAGKNQFQVANAEARLAWMDEQGIQVQNVICLSGLAYNLLTQDRKLQRETLETCNNWLADTCATSGGRLLPVTCPDWGDLDVAIAELTRMRARGSRVFLIPGHPVNGLAPSHPDWDRLWSAATDLGMAAMLHVGLGSIRIDPGWSRMGGDSTLLRQFGSSFRHVAPQTLLYSLVYGGVFERHPTLTVMLAEVGTGWLPFLFHEIDDRIAPTSELFVGKWSYPLKPSEYLARNVRATPLDAGNDRPLPLILEQLPDDVIVFSSDFPHFEGFTDPIGHYREILKGFPEKRLERFYGGSTADVYARMGDPLTIGSPPRSTE